MNPLTAALMIDLTCRNDRADEERRSYRKTLREIANASDMLDAATLRAMAAIALVEEPR